MESNLVPLGECCKFVSGSTVPSGEEYSNQPDGYLILKVSDLNLPENRQTVSLSSEWIADAPNGAMVCSANSIVLPKRGGAISTNKKRLLLRQAILDPNLMGITPQSSKLDPEYLYFWFQQFDLNSITSGSAVPQLNKQDLDPLRIPLPPLTEQKRIASLLARADRLRHLRRTAHELGESLLQSVFLEMFGDGSKFDRVEFEEILQEDPKNGLYLPAGKYGSGIPIIRIDAFYNGVLGNPKMFKRVNATEQQVKEFSIENNEILINRVNSIEYLGKCALVRELAETTLFESNMMRIRINRKLANPVYVTKFLTTPNAYSQILQKAKKAVNQASINQQDVKSLVIPIPPLSLQEEFASLVRRVESLRGRMGESERQVEGLFESLLSQSFGE